jgi:hypothetical protein
MDHMFVEAAVQTMEHAGFASIVEKVTEARFSLIYKQTKLQGVGICKDYSVGGNEYSIACLSSDSSRNCSKCLECHRIVIVVIVIKSKAPVFFSNFGRL